MPGTLLSTRNTKMKNIEHNFEGRTIYQEKESHINTLIQENHSSGIHKLHKTDGRKVFRAGSIKEFEVRRGSSGE